MNILITGGAGYVGSTCLRYLAGNGHKVVAFDDLRKGHEPAVDGHPLVKGDIADTALLVETMRKYDIDGVMHFAAATDVGESVTIPEYHYGNNIGGTLSLLNAMLEAGVKRILFSSTCATYGESQKEPMAEDTPQEPCSPYARSKLTVEWMIKDFAEAHELGYTLLRYFNAAGADPEGTFGEAHDPEFHLIPVVLQFCLGQRDKLYVFGNDYDTPDGTCVRDYIHVNDLASAHQIALERMTPKTREIFNVGTGDGQSVLEIIEACRRVTGMEIPYELTPRRPGDAPLLVANGDYMRATLDWAPKYDTIDAIIGTAWQWHKSHHNGYYVE
ncbi:MAG TPA: UDP-glucose 4-epimerase GalE [Rhodospirillales bacterium]|nr:UDP-glucose 4-epimerase GalE [Rhodospirillales bacterium]